MRKIRSLDVLRRLVEDKGGKGRGKPCGKSHIAPWKDCLKGAKEYAGRLAAQAAADKQAYYARYPEKNPAGGSALAALNARDKILYKAGLPNPADRSLDTLPYAETYYDQGGRVLSVSEDFEPEPLRGLSGDQRAVFGARLQDIVLDTNAILPTHRTGVPMETFGDFERYITTLFGRNLAPEEVAELSGQAGTAAADDVRQGKVTENRVYMQPITSNRLELAVFGPAVMDQTREIRKAPDGQIRIKNRVYVTTEATAKGAGPAMVLAQTRAVQNTGLQNVVIETNAYQDPPEWIGGYVWARCGFQGALNLYARKTIERELGVPDVGDIQTLLRLPGGSKWWKQNAADFDGRFDPSEGSVARDILTQYMEEKLATRAARDQIQESGAPRRESEQWLPDEEDEQIFDRIWARLPKDRPVDPVPMQRGRATKQRDRNERAIRRRLTKW